MDSASPRAVVSPPASGVGRLMGRAKLFAAMQLALALAIVAIQQPAARLLAFFLLAGSFGYAILAANRARSTIEAPIAARIDEAKAELEESLQNIEAIFERNPEPVSRYRLDGKLVRMNPAAVTLHGDDAGRFVDQHFTAHVHPDSQEDVKEAFRAAARGKTVRVDALYRRVDGALVDVDATFFPNQSRGAIDGVFGIAKDVTALKRAEREGTQHRRRLEQLYGVAASADTPWQERVQHALELGRSTMGFDMGFVLEILDGTNKVLCGVGASAGFVYTATPVEAALLRRALSSGEFVAVMDVGASVIDAATKALDLKGAFAVMPLVIEGRTFGAIGYSCSNARAPLAGSDRNFIKLIGAFVASSIENGRQRAKLDELAFNDSLTGLPNRSSLETRLQQQLDESSRTGERFAVHFLDLDGFKGVNDRQGHAIGDELLRHAAHRMATTLRAGDLLARIGGDEFVIVQPKVGDAEDATGLAARVMKRLAEPFTIEGASVSVGASVGIAMYPEHAGDTSTLLRAADAALYVAKRSGRGRVVIATTQNGLSAQGAVA